MSSRTDARRAGLGRVTRPMRAAALVATLGLLWMLVDVVIDNGPRAAADRFDRIDAYVDDQLDDSRIPGAAIAIVEGGSTVHSAGFGTDGHGNTVSADTPFWIGSNTKSMTALAVMQLVERGDVDLDTPVQQYVPDFQLADPDAAATITVRHLLNQTSGLSRSDGIRAIAAAPDQTMRDTVAEMSELDLDRPVGESFEYANHNSVVLGVLIEDVTGQRWQDYVREHIFTPLGMDTTFTDQRLAEAAGLTTTYRSFFGFPLATDGAHLDAFAASGYVYSTADDMARYLAMYIDLGRPDDERLLSATGIEEMLTAATDQRSFPLQSQQFTAAYGAGWFVGPFGAAPDARWHQGSLPHFTAWMVLLPDTDQAVVVLLNEGNQFEIGGANAAWSRIPQGIVDILRDQSPPTGAGSARWFIVYTTLVAAMAVGAAGTLASLVRSGLDPERGRTRQIVRAACEIGFGGLALLAYPSLTGGLGWSASFEFLPDLTLTVMILAGLTVISGAVRTSLLIQHESRRA